MTEPSEHPAGEIRAGDRVAHRYRPGSVGHVEEVHRRGAGFFPPDLASEIDQVAWVKKWEGQAERVAEPVADLIKLIPALAGQLHVMSATSAKLARNRPARELGAGDFGEAAIPSLSVMPGVVTHGRITAGTIALRTAGPTQADWIRWSGIVVVCAGALVAAPDGVAQIRDGITDTARKFWRRLIAQLVRVLPWLRKDANVQLVTARANLRVPTPCISGRGLVWNEGDPEAQKIEVLRLQILELWEELNRAQQEAEQELRCSELS